MAMTTDVMTKACRSCGEEVSVDLLAKQGKAGRRAVCKPCWAKYMRGYTKRNAEKISIRNKAYKLKYPEKYRDSRLRATFGITALHYDQMLAEQNGCCACCGVSQDSLNRKLAVDHCHDTDMVRGLLCSNCNLALGQVGDNIEVLQNMIAYLRKHQEAEHG